MNKKTIVILFGGISNEYEVSLVSASTIISKIDRSKYCILPVGITKSGRWLLYDGDVDSIKNDEWEETATPAILSPDTSHKGLLKLVGDRFELIPVDVIFPVMHGKYGEDGSLQGLLELCGIPYVGCGVLGSGISMDKVFTKIIASSIGISQAKYVVVRKKHLCNITDVINKIESKLGYPCFVKPANSGSSVGITRACDYASLEEGLIKAFNYDNKVVVEQAIHGRELECAVLGNEEPAASCVGEVIAAADFYDYDAKYNNTESRTIVPADLDERIAEEIRKSAVNIFEAVSGSGLARVDFFVEDNTNRVIFNEINTLPGFTGISMYPMLWEHSGISISTLIETLIDFASELHCNDSTERGF